MAAIRELKEELRVDVEIIRSLGIMDFIENDYTMEYNWLLARIRPTQVPSLGEPEKYDSFKYIPFTEIQNYRLSPNMHNFIRKVKKR